MLPSQAAVIERVRVLEVPKGARRSASKQSGAMQPDMRVEHMPSGNARLASKRRSLRVKGSKDSMQSNDGREGSKTTMPLSAKEWHSPRRESKGSVTSTEVSNENMPVNGRQHRTSSFVKWERSATLPAFATGTSSSGSTTSPPGSRHQSKRASARFQAPMVGIGPGNQQMEFQPGSNGENRRSSRPSSKGFSENRRSSKDLRLSMRRTSKETGSIQAPLVEIGPSSQRWEPRPDSKGDSKGAGGDLRRSSKDLRLRNARHASKEETSSSPIQEEEPVVVIEQTGEPDTTATSSHKKDLFVICQELNVPYALGREAAHLWRQHVHDVSGDVLVKGRMPIKLFEELQGENVSVEDSIGGRSASDPALDKKDHINFHEFVHWFFTNGFRDELNIFDESTEQRYLKTVARNNDWSLVDVESCNDKFKKIDLNGNGVIDYEEFEVLIHSMIGLPDGETLPHSRVDTLWRDADTDHNGCLDLEEFMAFWIKSFGGNCPIQGFYRNFRRLGADLSS